MKLKAKLKVRVDHVKLAKLVKKMTSKADAAPPDKQVDVATEWLARIVDECIDVEVTIDGVPDV